MDNLTSNITTTPPNTNTNNTIHNDDGEIVNTTTTTTTTTTHAPTATTTTTIATPLNSDLNASSSSTADQSSESNPSATPTPTMVLLSDAEDVKQFVLKGEFDGTNFELAPSLEFEEATEEKIRDIMWTQGKPLVIRGLLSHWHDYKREDFSLETFKQKFGEHKLPGPRDIETFQDLEGWTVAQLIDHINSSDDAAKKRLLYGKDITPPAPWMKYVGERIQPYLIWKSNGDLLGELEPTTQPETEQLYVGDAGTLTPTHIDLCGTEGHNIIMYADPPEAGALWFCTATQDVQQVDDFFAQRTKKKYSLHEDNVFMPPKALLNAPFKVFVIHQREGDMVLLPHSCAHQVLNIQGKTLKFAWSRFPTNNVEECIEWLLPMYRALKKPQVYRLKAAVFAGLKKRIASVKEKKITKNLLDDFPRLIAEFERMLASEWIHITGKQELQLEKFPDEIPHLRVCNLCKADIWNRCYHSEALKANEAMALTQRNSSNGVNCANVTGPEVVPATAETDSEENELDICLDCVAEGKAKRLKRALGFKVWEQFSRRELLEIARESCLAYEEVRKHFQLPIDEAFSSKLEDIDERTKDNSSTATLAMSMHARSMSCHSCHIKFYSEEALIRCQSNVCIKSFCHRCAKRHYNITEFLQFKEGARGHWKCWFCQGCCKCPICTSKQKNTSTSRRSSSRISKRKQGVKEMLNDDEVQFLKNNELEDEDDFKARQNEDFEWVKPTRPPKKTKKK